MQCSTKVEFSDGTSFNFFRRERPELRTNSAGDPTHLICAAQYGNGTDPGTGAHNDDATFTLIQPVNTV